MVGEQAIALEDIGVGEQRAGGDARHHVERAQHRRDGTHPRTAVHRRGRGRTGHPRACIMINPNRIEETAMGNLIVAVVIAVFAMIVISKIVRVVPQQQRLGRGAARQVLRHARRRAAHPDAVPRRRPLQALAQGDRARHPGADLHHQGQRPGRRRRRPVLQDPQPGTRVLRHLRLHLRHLRSSRRRTSAARSARSTSTARSRSARTSTAQVVTEVDKASEAMGRQGPALRDQEHHPAAGRARGDGKADARRA